MLLCDSSKLSQKSHVKSNQPRMTSSFYNLDVYHKVLQVFRAVVNDLWWNSFEVYNWVNLSWHGYYVYLFNEEIVSKINCSLATRTKAHVRLHKGTRALDGYFFLSLWTIMKHAISVRWLANPNFVNTQIPHYFRSWYDYLIHFQNEELHAHQVIR